MTIPGCKLRFAVVLHCYTIEPQLQTALLTPSNFALNQELLFYRCCPIWQHADVA